MTPIAARPARRSLPRSRTHQRGSSLYVALILLILLSLIGVTAVQVTGLQERMSSNYRATQQALENAEASVRQRENDLDRQLDSQGAELIAVDEPYCQKTYSPSDWAADKNFSAPPTGGRASITRRIDQCISGYSSLKQGEVLNKEPNLVFQITAYATDRDDNASSDAVLDTVFIP
ncbi:PilX N-terminal domain-containing pilus assembly protein [Lysobacter sp. Root604]|uniref:pilus assembly PilX family protein n=1 Tax=Lysobacter sp. Root604 TaxID=1736568 RepID=UPI0006F68713|nr:PilX N-terminal domain-containing pilus assembly protein [Lysobacter sp. Root604]KRA15295.1 hypothetical protein ASD69_17620 [Lysobacter sp. Root604]